MPSLTLLSLTSNTALAAQNQLEEMFSDLVDIKSLNFGDVGNINKICDELVVVTSQTFYKQALECIESNTKVLLANRTVNIEKVSLLYEVPPNSSVLVVNKLYETAKEAIDQLEGVGISHLKFYPYFPEMTSWNDECKYAVTFGERQLIPSSKFEIIDLGIRPIDITTCIEIAIKLNIYNSVRHTLTSVFLKPSLQLLYHYSKEYNRNLFLSEKLQQLLNIFKSGVVLLDENLATTFYNDKAQQLLEIVDNRSSILNGILEKSSIYGTDFFYSINEKNCHIEIKYSKMGIAFGTMITIEDIQNIERIEKKYRLSLHERGLTAEYSFDNILYKSKRMEQIILKAHQFSKGNSTILIEGESGTGKELLAQAIHNFSNRKREAFVAVNFAAINENLFESELFGYEDGAFTGAKKGGKKGLFALAHKGTIFLDEIGDAPISIQKKVLRVIQERQILPVGGSQVIPIDIRIIAATNRNLQKMVDEGLFREDLYYRLNVLPLSIPPLRERKEDIVPIFISIMKNKFNIYIENLQEKTIAKLESCAWNGNVRELRNLAEYIDNYSKLDINWEEELNNLLIDKLNKKNNVLFAEEKTIIKELEGINQIEIYIKILKVIDSSPIKWSRKTLTEAMCQNNLNISESQLKMHLITLKKFDLIQSKTGVGTYIKDKGRGVVYQYENY